MKKITFIILGVLMTFSAWCQSDLKMPFTINLEIQRIDTIKGVNIIYGKNGDSIYKLVSSKVINCDCSPILIGNKYELKIKSLMHRSSNTRELAGILFDEVLIYFEDKPILWDLFLVENLKGLCLID